MARKNILNTKVLLKSYSLMKFSQNFSAVKMVAVASHQWCVQPVVASYISFGVGCCLYPLQGNARSPPMDKDNKFPHLIFVLQLSSGNWGAYTEQNICLEYLVLDI